MEVDIFPVQIRYTVLSQNSRFKYVDPVYDTLCGISFFVYLYMHI